MEVALLIPTLNRPDFIERIIGYYDSLNSQHPIYIGDASDSEGSAKNVATLKKFNNVRVKYFHWEGVDISRTVVRLAESAQAESKYCVWHPDDDYFVPSSLSSCTDFLDENPDYKTAQGRAAIFMLDRPGSFGEIKSLGQYWGVNSLEQETSLDRLESFKENYYVLQLSVHRVDEFLISSKDFFEVQDYSHGELLHCYTFAMQGKSKFIDCLYMVRSHHVGRVYNPFTFVDWVMRPGWSSDLEKCIVALSRTLHESSDLSLDHSRKVISELLEDRFKESSFLEHSEKRKTSFLSRVKRLLPVELVNILKQLRMLTMDAKDLRLLGSKRSLFYKDFQPVLNSLTKKTPGNDQTVS